MEHIRWDFGSLHYEISEGVDSPTQRNLLAVLNLIFFVFDEHLHHSCTFLVLDLLHLFLYHLLDLFLFLIEEFVLST